ncbi:restriction endonuclease [Luteolibacter sp. Populi]|uniref:nSTAND3 domain-containing NTPase n=1 Tax=Luteolibacter sp. Populi TaxID=3230487 RepID=UPI003466643E
MPNYNFTENLSPLDFELLSKDLLEVELGLQFENFREGRDGGIDLRHAPQSGGGETIVQCKRFAEGAFASLKSTLVRDELPKIRKLNPSRYILSTSVALSPQQSKEISKLLAPFILTTGDIFGRDRLNSMLAKHPDIERQHNKLWIKSASIIQDILNSKIHVVSQEELENTVSAARIYVKNESFNEALAILKEYRVCIISGIPGIGKTTLARMLLLYFHGLDYEIVKIESNISEARSVPFHRRARFYYYDDFLGQTASADKLGKNEDQKLLDFLKSIRESETSIAVLTTREYILHQAQMIYEKLSRVNLDSRKCIMDLSKYSRKIKAQILYNHLYFSKLPKQHIDNILQDRAYAKIVDHRNYSPRLIETLTDLDWIADIPAPSYAAEFVQSLDNPESLWNHAYRWQLRPRSKNMLLVLTTLPTRTEISDLRKAFSKFHLHTLRKSGGLSSPEDFIDSLKELDGTFIKIEDIRGGKIVAFHNPSIRDFMQNILFSGTLITSLSRCSIFYEQAVWLWDAMREKSLKVPRQVRDKYAPIIARDMMRLYATQPCKRPFRIYNSQQEIVSRGPLDQIRRLATLEKVLKESKTPGRRSFIEDELISIATQISSGAISPSEIITWIATFRTKGYNSAQKDGQISLATKASLGSNVDDVDNFELIGDLEDAIPGTYTPYEIIQLKQKFHRYLEEKSCREIAGHNDEPDEIRGVADRIESIGRFFELDTQTAETAMKEYADEKEGEIEERRDWEPDDDDRSIDLSEEHFSDDALDSMFRTLE